MNVRLRHHGELVEHGVGIDTGEQQYLLNPDVSPASLKAQMVDYYDARLRDDDDDEDRDPRQLAPDARIPS